jgi:NADH dehydrogenase FAD-containing subunit
VPCLFTASSLAYTSHTLADLHFRHSILTVNCRLLNIDRDNQHILLQDGSVLPYDVLLLSKGLQDQTLKRLPLPKAENDYPMDIFEGTITLNDETDALANARFLHIPPVAWEYDVDRR